jgi:hypothetical protein
MSVDILESIPNPIVPELKLYYGIMFQLIADLQATAIPDTIRGCNPIERIRRDAISYIYNDPEVSDPNYVTFRQLCDALDLDIEETRVKLEESGAIPKDLSKCRGLSRFAVKRKRARAK